MLIANHTGQIFMPYHSFRGVAVEPMKKPSFYVGGATHEEVIKAIGGREVFEARFCGEGIAFTEHYMSIDDANKDIDAMERARIYGNAVIYRMGTGTSSQEYEKYVADYLRAAKAIEESRKPAYAVIKGAAIK